MNALRFLRLAAPALLLAACASSPTGGTDTTASTAGASSGQGATTGGGTAATSGAAASSTGSTSGTTSGSTGTTSGSSTEVPRVDELGYYAALAAQRPDLLTTTASCYAALVLKQIDRPLILDDAGATPQSLEDSYQSDAGVAADQAYILAQQQAEVALCQADPVAGCSKICATACGACPSQAITDSNAPLPSFYASGYSLCAFVGYEEGPYLEINQNGLDYKVFFEFADATAALTSSAYQTFSAALADAGYQGDTKVLADPSLPLQARFQYNDIITHSSTAAGAEIAEQVGLAMFGAQLTGYGRGLDVGPPIYTTLVDWHDYLCDVDGSLAALPSDAQAYVTFAN